MKRQDYVVFAFRHQIQQGEAARLVVNRVWLVPSSGQSSSRLMDYQGQCRRSCSGHRGEARLRDECWPWNSENSMDMERFHVPLRVWM